MIYLVQSITSDESHYILLVKTLLDISLGNNRKLPWIPCNFIENFCIFLQQLYKLQIMRNYDQLKWSSCIQFYKLTQLLCQFCDVLAIEESGGFVKGQDPCAVGEDLGEGEADDYGG